ncbi:hypothetical protein [Actinomadura sp. HBU206391]|uniref:hypothetical protein n=1 Tax=Actinomadura sp. HBU206391 TaxID=2731692 RepID=UPI00164F8427|nr:hypothetical protein [Actinomadura sp. HBU206391]MBC6456542.1 hypothetical protein [Actinomadura sp. HBU206391]
MHSEDLHPVAIPGYSGGPYTHHREFLDEHLFWLGHLHSCAGSEEAEELLFGPDYEASGEFHLQMNDTADWPTFTLALTAGHRFHIVCRTFEDDPGTDYLLHHPDWEQAELLAADEGHFMGPGLSWPELTAIAFNGQPGGSAADPHARLLLLLPALGDDDLPDDAPAILAPALADRTAVPDPGRLAELLLEGQGACGPAHWTTSDLGVRVNDGHYSFRNPANPFAPPPHRLAQVSAALTP